MTSAPTPARNRRARSRLAAWSSATIRHELSTLVDVGYLLQPHTSAGRVPSDLGYRYYVDFLMPDENVPPAVRHQLEPFFKDAPGDLEQLLEVAAMALAVATDAVSIVTGPRMSASRIKHVDLVALASHQVLILLVFEGNLIKQQTVTMTNDCAQEELSRITSLFNETMRGLAADEIGEWPKPEGLQQAVRVELTNHILEFVRSVDSRQDAVVVHDGMRNLLQQPEFVDVERVQQVLEIVEEERILGEMLTSMELSADISIVIGKESGVEQLSECSLVLTTYRAGGTRTGTIGVLGPTRMRYSQVAPRVRFVAQRIGDALQRMLG